MVARIENSVCKKALWLLAERRRLGRGAQSGLSGFGADRVRKRCDEHCARQTVRKGKTEAHS
jgi:hypothetical protein